MRALKIYLVAASLALANAFHEQPTPHKRGEALVSLARRNRATVWYDDEMEDNCDRVDDTPHNTMKEKFQPKTQKQKDYYKHINDDALSLVIASGPAGTGKTLLPTQHAAKLLLETEQKVILTRPLISVDEELGYLPGTINQKMDPWIIPIFDVLLEFFSQKTLNKFMAEKRLEIVPLAFMRGRTFKDTFIIGDELQNTSNKQMLMLLTRIGENSKMIITGDIHQCDNTENGLMDLLNRISKKYNVERNNDFKEDMMKHTISMIEFEASDIQRSAIITTILDLYEN